MLGKRLISSAFIIGVMLALVSFDYQLGRDTWLGYSGLVLAPLLLLLSAMACGEMTELFGKQTHRPATSVTIIACVVAMLLACVPVMWREYPADCLIGKSGWTMFGLAAGVGIIFVAEMIRFREPGESIQRVALGVLCVGYLAVMLSFLVSLRLFRDNAWGMTALLSVVIITKFSDAGAYAAGKLYGRNKFWPTLSPNKTWEGVAGALVSGCLVSVVLFVTLVPWLTGQPNETPLWAAAVYGLIVTLAGMIGDLAESLLKRDAQIKDSSRWLPGLGGALDVMDSLLASAPAAFACWAVGLVGPG